jgi:carbonic anhydrase
LRSIIDRILIAVRGAALALAAAHGSMVHERAGYRQALTETSVVLNAAWTAHSLDREFRPADAGHANAPVVAFGIYDLASRKVWSPRAASTGEVELMAGLMAAPEKAEAFTDLARAVASGANVVRLLDQR